MAQYNVAEPFLASVRAHPDKTAVVFDGREITYRAMNDRINQMAGVLMHTGCAGCRCRWLSGKLM